MDGISNAAAIVGLVQAGVQATTALNRYISRVKKAESSCTTLLGQIRLIFAVEKAIKTAVQSPPPSLGYSPDLQSIIDEWFKESSPPNKCKAQLEELSTWLESQVESNKYKRLVKKMGWPAKEDKIEETIKAFNHEYMSYFNAILLLVNHEIVVNATAVLMKAERATPESELLSWFDGFDCTNKQESTFQQRQKKTGEWLFKEELFKAWRMGSTKFIWLHGKPGAGKSVLASAVIGDLLSAPKDNEALAYFYCDFRNPRCTSAKEVLRSLTRQLLWSSKKEWLSSFSDLITRKARGAGPPTDLRLLLDLLKRAAAFHERPIMMVDALDECDDGDLPNLLDALMELVHADYCLFVTSRTLPMIEDAFSNLSTIFLDDRIDKVQGDIHMHVEIELKSRSRLQDLGQDIKDKIQYDLMEKADGMFRWAQCQLDRLNDCYSIRDIHEVLRTLPETLHETYDQMLHTIDKKPFGARIARRALMWLVTALQPLGLRQLVEALTLSSDEPVWDSTCAPLDEHVILEVLGSFVVIDHTDNIITLSHYSVKEYLTSDTLAYSTYYVHSPDASLELAKASIFALILHQGGEGGLSSYADSDGLEHLKDCDAAHNEALVKHLLILQDCTSTTRPGDELLRNSWDNPWMVRVQQVALYIILRYGHLSMLSHYLDHHLVQATPQDNPLVFAACHSSIASVQSLLAKGLDINLEGSVYAYHDVRRMSPLTAAAQHRTRECQEPLVQLLLENGCVVSRDAICVILSSEMYAPFNPSVLRILLDCGADPKLLSAGNNSCLHLLFESYGISLEDKLEIAQILVENGCDPAVLNDKGYSPLIAAARNAMREGQERFVRFLLANGCTVPTDAIHATLSHHSYAPCNPAVIRVLLAHAADPKILAVGNNSSLHLLFNSGGISPEDQLEIAQILIDNGCDPAALNDKGCSPLIAAARNVMREGQERLVQFLLANGCTVPMDAIHATLLHRSYTPCNPAVIRVLLAHGADPKMLATGNNSSLHLLFRSGGISPEDQLEISQILVDNGCNPATLNDKGYSPLIGAARNAMREGQEHLVQFLLANGCTVPADAIHATFLYCHYAPCNPAVIRVLLAHGADPKMLVAGNNSSLHLLLKSGGISPKDQLEIAQILIDNGCTLPDCQDEDGCNVLHLLCKCTASLDYESFAYLLQLLVEFGCDINSRNKDGNTPFCLAVPCPYSSRVVDLFVSQGAEIPVDIINHVVAHDYPCRNEREVIAALTTLKRSGASFQSQTQDGENALHCLLDRSDSDPLESILAIASFLIESGCDIHASCDGLTLLELAIKNGQFLIAETLLARVASGPGLHNEHTKLFHDDSTGSNILHRLCRRGELTDKLKFLQKLRYDLTKDINRQDYDGLTPLCAVLCQLHADPGVITSLLAFGASFNHVNYVYLDNIQWASNLSWYPDATDAHKRYISRSNISCDDVVLVQHLLRAYRCRLSSVVINSILNMGEYWACMKVVEYDIWYDETNRRNKHIVFPAVPGEMGSWIPRRVVLSWRSNTKLNDSHSTASANFFGFHVTRGGTKFRVPGLSFGLLSDFPRTKFTVWNGFQPALHEDEEQKVMLAELLPGDMLSMEFKIPPRAEDDRYALEFLQMDVYYSINNSLSDECN